MSQLTLREQSPTLARLLDEYDEPESTESSTSPNSQDDPSPVDWEVCRPVKIEPTVETIVLPRGQGFDYNRWSESDIRKFLFCLIRSKPIIDVIMSHEVTGSSLFSCFLHEETSEIFRRMVGLTQGQALKIRMTLGRVHNVLYGLD
ncbi:hypothetical protein GCK72_006904 [Caenorhabditis remanei]|uniref:SAM domain-containing protein n=1 Tax=Caenorhabditis remanei TaxID=31234 RepID=A0A6A5HJT6_CAERE|nr:hypothetical protein GCK72_006904 [Caenorhabditis remanei]KAF1766946.1 hypothetical protein GCK72_006904 [Caenorhabditis remanei]